MDEFTMMKKVSDGFLNDILHLALICAEENANEVDFDIDKLHVHIEFSTEESEE